MMNLVFDRIGVFEVKVENAGYVNPLPHMPILGSYNSTANKDMTSKIQTNAGIQ